MARRSKPKTMDTQEKQVTADWELSKRMLFAGGIPNPIFVLHTADKPLAIEVSYESDAQKRLEISFIHVAMVAAEARAVSVFYEAWTRPGDKLPGETPLAHKTRMMETCPSDCADRIDTLCAYHYSLDEDGELRVDFRHGAIQRDAQGRATAVKPILALCAKAGDGRHEGLFTDVIDHALTTAFTEEEREVARMSLARSRHGTDMAAAGVV